MENWVQMGKHVGDSELQVSISPENSEKKGRAGPPKGGVTGTLKTIRGHSKKSFSRRKSNRKSKRHK